MLVWAFWSTCGLFAGIGVLQMVFGSVVMGVVLLICASMFALVVSARGRTE